MRTITVPEELLRIPFPWNVTRNSIRRKYIDALDQNKQNIEKALFSLELCLKVLSELSCPGNEHLPDDIEYYWIFIAEEIGEKIPTLEKFDIAYIEQVFYEDKIESITELMIEQAAESWIGSVPFDTSYSCIVWLEKAMKNCQDAELVDRYLGVARNYWQSSIPNWLITDLVSTSKWIAGEKAIPLLKEVEQNSQDRDLADLARDFRRLTIDPN